MHRLIPVLLMFAVVRAEARATDLQPPAKVTEISSPSPVPFAQFVGTMKLLASRDTGNGVSISIFSVQEKLGECENSSGAPIGANARSCPRESILISMTLQRESGSKFKLYKTSPRLNWKLPNVVIPKNIQPHPYRTILLACEASSAVDIGARPETDADRWHYVEYELIIGDFDKVALTRLVDTGKYQFCSE